MKKEGIEFRTNTEVGVDVSIDKLRADFDADGSAVMVGRGAKRARDEFEDEWGEGGD